MKSGSGDFPFFSRTDSIVLTTGIRNPLISLENKTGGVFSRDPDKNNRDGYITFSVCTLIDYQFMFKNNNSMFQQFFFQSGKEEVRRLKMYANKVIA